MKFVDGPKEFQIGNHHQALTEIDDIRAFSTLLLDTETWWSKEYS